MSRSLLALLFLSLLLSGCSSLLYHPSRYKFSDPEQELGLKPQEIEFASEDGTQLYGWYFESGPSPKGMIVFFHGNGENLSSHYRSLAWVLKEGYDFFIFGYQGYGGSEGSPSPSGTIMDGKAAIRKAHFINPALPVIVFAQSLGGAVALRTVAEIKQEIPIQLVVVDCTFHSYRSVARSFMARSWLTWLFQPLAYVVLSDRYGPEESIPQIAPIPLVVMHGEKDPVVNFEFGKKVFELAQEPKEFWPVPEGGHIDGFARKDAGIREKFLAKLNEVTAKSAKTAERKISKY